MTYSIIGSGKVGTALARQFARSGIAAGIANTRGPASIADLTNELEGKVTPMTLPDALKADVVILAVPFRAHRAVAAGASDWTGKIVIDAMNTYDVPPEELKGQASSDVVAAAFPAAKVVKTLNQLPAKLLAANPAENGGRRVMFVSSNDEKASESIAKLVGDLGFAPIAIGKINEGGRLLEKDRPLVLQNLIKQA
jgi:hypothetical protein